MCIRDSYERMNNMIHRVKSDRSDLDMVCEIMLKLGVPLIYSITAVEINDKTAYSIGEDCLLLICLAPDVQPEDVEQMAEYAPEMCIRDRYIPFRLRHLLLCCVLHI